MLGRRRTVDDFGIASAPFVIVVVLVSALMHASWNAVVKGAEEGLVTQADVVLGGALYAVPSMFEVPFPNAEACMYLGLSALIHCAYFAALAAAYGFRGLGFIYPIARGSGPVLVAGLSALTIGELLYPAQLAGVLIICLGVLALAVTGRSGGGLGGYWLPWPSLAQSQATVLQTVLACAFPKRRFLIYSGLSRYRRSHSPFSHCGDGSGASTC